MEFPSLGSLSGELPPSYFVVDLAVNAGNDFLEFDYDNAGSGLFGSAFFNGYRFTFDSAVAATITGATVNQGVTTNGLTDSRLSFSGNQLSVNVQGLPFNSSMFGRIDLAVEGGPGGEGEPDAGSGGGDGGPEVVPLPATLPILISGLAVLGGLRRRRS